MIDTIYKEIEKERRAVKPKIREFGWIVWAFFLAILIFSVTTLILSDQISRGIINSIGLVRLLLIIVLAIIIMKCCKIRIEQIKTKKYGDTIERFYTSLELIKGILSRRNMLTRSKVTYLLEIYQEKADSVKITKRIFSPLGVLASTALIPSALGFLNWAFNQASTISDAVTVAVLYIIIIGFIMGLLWSIKTMLTDLFDTKYESYQYIIERLKAILAFDFGD